MLATLSAFRSGIGSRMSGLWGRDQGRPWTPPTPVDIEAMEARMLDLPQVEIPVVHHFGPGVYMRECTMPAGAAVIGHEHTTEHLNIVLSGSAYVLVNGAVEFVERGNVFLSPAGSRKLGIIREEMRFMTIHPTTETDIGKLEALLIRKSDTFLAHQALELAHIAEAIKTEGSA